MLAACLPATGPDEWVIALLVAAAVALLVAGAVFVVRSKKRIALLFIPLAALTFVLAAPAQPSQAESVPGFTVGNTEDTVWFNDGANFYQYDTTTSARQALTPDQLAVVEQLFEVLGSQPTATSTFAVSIVNNDPPNEAADLPGVAGIAGDGLAVADANAVLDAIDTWESTDITMTITWTVDYSDECGKPAQTVIVYTGVMGFAA